MQFPLLTNVRRPTKLIILDDCLNSLWLRGVMQTRMRRHSTDSQLHVYQVCDRPGDPISESRRTLLAWLITYTGDDEFKIRQMMDMVGVTVTIPHRALAISIERQSDPREVASILDKIGMCWGLDFFCRASNRAYIFWSLWRHRSNGDLDEIASVGYSSWMRLGSPGRLLIGVGSPASDGKGLKRSLDEAEICLSLLENGLYEKAGSVQVLEAEQVHIYQLLRLIRNEADLRAFVQQWLGPLLNHDEVHGTHFLRTLEVYLDCGGSLREAAKRLCLHPRGVRYRLDRILELLGIDSPTPTWKLAAHVAVKASRLIRAHCSIGNEASKPSRNAIGRWTESGQGVSQRWH